MQSTSWLDLCYEALGVAGDLPEQERRRQAEHALLLETDQPIDILGIGAAETAIDLVVRFGEAGRLDEVMLLWEQGELLGPQVGASSDEGNRRATICAKRLLHDVVSWTEGRLTPGSPRANPRTP